MKPERHQQTGAMRRKRHPSRSPNNRNGHAAQAFDMPLPAAIHVRVLADGSLPAGPVCIHGVDRETRGLGPCPAIA